MTVNTILLTALILLVPAAFAQAPKIPVLETGSKAPMPDIWIDKDTGNKLIHLTRRKGDNRSFYFHENPFVPANANR